MKNQNFNIKKFMFSLVLTVLAVIAQSVAYGDSKIYWIAANDDGTAYSIESDELNRQNRQTLVTMEGRANELVVDNAGEKIYWIASDTNKTIYSIQSADFDGQNQQNLVIGSENESLFNLTVDSNNGKIYWTNYDKGTTYTKGIWSADLNGQNLQTLFTGNAGGELYDLVVDSNNGKIYWTDYDWDEEIGNIRSADLNGQNLQTLVTKGDEVEELSDLVVNNNNGKMYWVEYDWFTDSDTIWSADLNGHNQQVLVEGNLSDGLFSLVVDNASDKIYWIEYEYDTGTFNIWCADPNGQNRQKILTRNGSYLQLRDIVVDSAGGKIFWKAFDTIAKRGDHIRCANLNGQNQQNLVTVKTKFTRPIYDYVVEILPTDPTMTSVKLSPSPTVSPDVGERLTLALTIEAGADVVGYKATLNYDSIALRYVESANGDYLHSGVTFAAPVVEGNTVTLAATSTAAGSNGAGTLATVTFEVVAAKTSTLSLSDVELSNSIGAVSQLRVEYAKITEFPILPGDINKDGVVNILDLVVIASNFGQEGDNVGDFNGDGVVNIFDLIMVSATFGDMVAAPSAGNGSLSFLLDGFKETISATDVQRWLREAREVNLTTPDFQRGILILEQLLAALTPKETTLLPNYPNPFNPETWIPYQLAAPTDVTISIYAANGKLVRTLDLGHQAVGLYHHRNRAAYWDGKNALGESVASGIYFYTLTAGDFTATRKMVIRK